MNWRDVWERKGRVEVDSYDLETLIALDGFDVGLGKLGGSQFRQLAAMIVRTLGLAPGARLLEVGCGAGALLACLLGFDVELLGLDYAESLIEHARRAVPKAVFEVAEATAVPFTADAIVCHSVFQYFPDLSYARRALAAQRRSG